MERKTVEVFSFRPLRIATRDLPRGCRVVGGGESGELLPSGGPKPASWELSRFGLDAAGMEPGMEPNEPCTAGVAAQELRSRVRLAPHPVAALASGWHFGGIPL